MSSKRTRNTGDGSQPTEQVVRDLLGDRRDALRLLAALERHAAEGQEDSSYVQLACDVTRLLRNVERFLEFVRSPDWPRCGGDVVSGEVVRAQARQRKDLREVLEELPALLFTGLDVPEDANDAAEAARLEPQRVAKGEDLESALLQLPTPWLRSVRRRYDIRRHRARTRIAALIADRVDHPHALGFLLDRNLGSDHLRLLGRIVAAERLPLDALPPASLQGFGVPHAWWQTAKGVGGQLRQLGLVFVGEEDGRAAAYVPRGARPAMADVLADRLLQLGQPGDAELASALEALAAPARARHMREEAGCAGVYLAVPNLPSRLCRVRHRTPGPDRVIELEIHSEDKRQPAVRRILISYQRALGALRQVAQLSLAQVYQAGRIYAHPVEREPCLLWLDPASGGYSNGARDEWATSIRDALTVHGPRLRYHGHELSPHFTIRVVRVHAPELVEQEPRVVWGEGVCNVAPYSIAPPQLDASLNAANLLLKRLS